MNQYTPIIVAIIAASIAYLYSQRNNKINLFHKQVEVSLKEFVEPLYFQLRFAKVNSDPEQREKLLDNIFSDFNSRKKNLHVTGNWKLIEQFLVFEELYFTFKTNRTETNWKAFWASYEDLYFFLEKEYWKNFNSLYNNYLWYQQFLNTNFVLKFFIELSRSLKQIIHFIFAFYGLIIYLLLWEKFISPISKILKEFFVQTLDLFTLILTLYGLILMFNGIVITSAKQRRLLSSSSINKNVNKEKRKFLTSKNKANLKLQKRLETPEMFKKYHL